MTPCRRLRSSYSCFGLLLVLIVFFLLAVGLDLTCVFAYAVFAVCIIRALVLFVFTVVFERLSPRPVTGDGRNFASQKETGGLNLLSPPLPQFQS